MKIKPIKDRVAIKQDEAQDKTMSGLILPDSAKEKPLSGEVIAVGPQCKEVEVGEKVYYQKYRGTEVDQDGDTIILMREEDILAII
jgi:chaperonin GroES